MSPSSIYESAQHGALRQGEILSGLVHSSLTETSAVEYLKSRDPNRDYQISLFPIDFSVVLSQDCDLEQEHQSRTENVATGTLPFVLFAIAAVAEEFRRDNTLKSRELWKQFCNNKMERYQYLAAIDPTVDAAATGIPALGIDFKRYLTIPTELVYVQVQNGVTRRARLRMPFAEHLSDRFFAYHARIALPAPHFARSEADQDKR